MAFQEDLAKHVEQIRGRIPHMRTGEKSASAGEEATKQALVVPLLQVLGFDVFDPREVRPEYTADFAVKKAGQFEKVDYAIYLNGAIALFVECKALNTPLHDHGGQLARYFNATPSVRVALITDGVRIRVFTDLRQPNIMDPDPWLDIDLLSIKPAEVDALRRFRKADFVPEEIVLLAEEMVYYNAILATIAVQLREPNESFVRWVAGEIPAVGRVTGKVVERLSPILRKAIQSAIVDHVARSFDRPIEPPTTEVSPAPPPAAQQPPSEPEASPEARAGVVTTEDELEIARLVGGWIREVHPEGAVAFRDGKTYFTLHQNNLRKWFARFCLDRKPGWVALRHVRAAEGRQLAPGVEVGDGGSYGDSRFTFGGLADLPKLRSVIIAAYDREAARITDEPAEGDGPASGP